MPSFNKVILIGNLTRDPDVRVATNGTTITKIGLAVSRTWNDPSGRKQEETAFVDIDAFGKQAEVIGKYFKKGKPILIEGRLKMNTWKDKQTGQNRNKLGVIMEKFEFVGSPTNPQQGSSNHDEPTSPSSRSQPAKSFANPFAINEDDEPF